MRYLVGIDVGTTGTKTVVFDTYGSPVASKTVEYPLYQPHNGWSEQDPADWWNAAVTGLRAVLGGIDKSEIAGIGLSGQMHGLVMLGKDNNVLRPAIIWCDQRTAKECEQMNELIGPERVIEITGNPPMTGFTASKILWVRNNEPEIYDKCAHIMLPKDYIRFRLTGEYATEVSDASGMQLMDIPGRCWSREVLDRLGIDIGLLPSMHESPDMTGRVHAAACEETGLPAGIPVAGGAGDNPAAAVSTGAVRESVAFTTIGSSAVIYAVSGSPRIDLKGRVHGLCASIPGKWTVMSCTQGAGLSLKWMRDTLCIPEVMEAKEENTDPYVVMDRHAEKIPAGSNKLIYLPYLMGERSPHPDPDCRGVFFGLSAIHGRADMIRAVLEGVAFSQLECVEVFREMGVSIEDMFVCGGGSRSPLWRQMLADLYGCPVSTLAADEGAALGAALLGGVSAGVYSSVDEAVGAAVRRDKTVLPDRKSATEYMPYYSLYKKLYRDLKDRFKELASI